ncbi:hypothetical protein GCM10010433_71140 [Streptomyces pulveraceus]
MHFPPSHSPGPNPDELISPTPTSNAVRPTHRAGNQAERAAEARHFSHRRRRRPHIACGCFGGPHACYTLDENPVSL